SPEKIEGALAAQKTQEKLGWPVEVGERGEACRAAERAVIQSGTPNLQVHLKGTLPGNRRFCFLVSRVAMFDDTGAICGVLVTYEDIGEWVLAQDMLHRARRMESLSALAGGVGSELDRFKSSLMTCVDRLRNMPGADTRLRELDDIAEISRHAGLLARQLRVYAARQITEPSEFSLADVVTKLMPALHRQAGTAVAVRLDPAPVVSMIRSDPHLVEQAVVNLVRFARDCMPGGGEVDLSIAHRTLGHLEAVRLGVASGEYLVLRSLHGSDGLSPGTAAHLFEPYFLPGEGSRRRDPGSGLELAVVHGVARHAGGGARAITDADGKLTLEVLFPRVYTSSKTPRAEPELTTRSRGTERLLVVVDGSSLRAAMVSLLASLGYQAEGAMTSGDVVTQVRERASDERPVALVVLDASVDLARSLELASKLRKARPELRVLALHGHASFPEGDAPTELAWLAKPFRFEALAHSVRQLL
ncbi:MAG: hypothetical protein ACPG77_14235, partial [Nannocystaceae bacterium]